MNVNHVCTRDNCDNELVNPTHTTKYCNDCKKIVQAEQVANSNAKIAEESRIRRIENGIEPRPEIDKFWLERGPIGIRGGKLFE